MSGTSAAEPSARKWQALCGLFPLGVFLVEHVVLNARSLIVSTPLESPPAIRSAPMWSAISTAVEIGLVLVPLAFHAVLGIVLTTRARSNMKDAQDAQQNAQQVEAFNHWDRSPSPYPSSWRVLNRAAAYVALLFIIYHVYAVRYARAASGLDAGAMHTLLVAHLSNASGSADGVLMPWTAIGYLIGLAATILHFSVSVWGYLVRFHHVRSPLAVRRTAVASGAVGALLFGLSSLTVISFASGAPVFPPSPPSAPCPTPQ